MVCSKIHNTKTTRNNTSQLKTPIIGQRTINMTGRTYGTFDLRVVCYSSTTLRTKIFDFLIRVPFAITTPHHTVLDLEPHHTISFLPWTRTSHQSLIPQRPGHHLQKVLSNLIPTMPFHFRLLLNGYSLNRHFCSSSSHLFA